MTTGSYDKRRLIEWLRDVQSLRERRAKYVDDAEALAALDEVAKEPAMHRRSGHHYGYTFLVARRV